MRKLITVLTLVLALTFATVSFGQGKTGFENNTIRIGTTVFSEKAFSSLNDIHTKSTGLISGGDITVNGGDNTLIDITAGSGQIVDCTTDPNNPISTPVSWDSISGYDLTTMPASGDVVAIFISIDVNGDVVEGLALPTPEERRSYINLGIAARIDNSIIVFAGTGSTNIIPNPTSQLHDLMEALGPFNYEGNRVLPYGTGLQFQKEEGSIFSNGSNSATDLNNPHIKFLDELIPVDPFNYKLGDGTDITLSASQLDPDHYDDGSSELATMPNNEWSVQRLSVFSSNIVEVLYGQEIFDDMGDAVAALSNIEFIIPSDSKGAIPLYYVVLQQGETSIPEERYILIPRGGGGGGSVNYFSRTGTDITPKSPGDNFIVAVQTELAAYPDFSSNPNWTIYSGSNTWTYDGDNDRMRPTGELTGDVIANTGISLTSGTTYVITVSWVKSAGSLQIYQGSAGTLKSDYMDDDTLSRRWVFIATASENVFVRTTAAFHDDETTDYISSLSVIKIDNEGDIVGGKLALGGLRPEYYSQLESYADAALFFPSDKGIVTVSDFAIRNVNSGGLDYDETYARIILATYGISAAFGSNGYTTTSLRADSNINLRTYTAGGAITVNESSINTDFVLNGSGVEAYKYDAGSVIHAFTGNVGMGINSPGSILHIKANTPGTVGSHPAGQLIIQDPDDDVLGVAVITGYESDADGNPDQQLWYFGSSSSSNQALIILNRRNANLHLGTNNTTCMTIEAGGNIGIGTNNPQGALDVSSTTGAFIVPRMTTAQRDALTAVNGMIIYNTSTNQFNFYENGAWVTK